ncbi:ATP-binding protein [Neptuniibacter sp.]|uniref:ATP-binding protein n=1 Tax=Neptuniibacter sp. TaxID=1962643 RepID=UPI003B5AD6FF
MNINSPLHSLQGRLLIASVVILPLVLLLAGLALSRAYEYSQENELQQRLQLQVYLLLGSIDLKEEHIQFPERLTEPRYDRPHSGLYAAIHDQSGQLLWRSLSSITLVNKEIERSGNITLAAGEPQFQHLSDESLFRYQLRIIWEFPEEDKSLIFTVMESDIGFVSNLKEYNQHLLIWMSIIFLVALLAQTLILRWGLFPLRKLAKDLKAIESGSSELLSGHYPDEVEPVTQNLNGLIESERQQRERYRNTLGDLAHSLKTPLAVMRGAGEEKQSIEGYKKLVDEQVLRMDQIVQYQLSRAVKSQNAPLGKAVSINPIVERMLSALGKVYRDKAVTTEVDIPTNLKFPGDERDLMELLGNLLENAFKYGDSKVGIRGDINNQLLQLHICDDGPGVPVELRQVILKRGERLDTSVQGQGIGLSVVTDIISSYQGELEIADSPYGGSCFIIRMPV